MPNPLATYSAAHGLALARRTAEVVIFCAAIWAGASGRAGDCCSRCQSHTRCTKVCRLVYEEKKVDVVCWGCMSEEFCVPGPSRAGCEHCETVCDPCREKLAAAQANKESSSDRTEGENGNSGPVANSEQSTKLKRATSFIPKKFVWTTWIPTNADIYTRKKLMKQTVTKKIPSYRWVVEELCPQCAASLLSAPVESHSSQTVPHQTK